MRKALGKRPGLILKKAKAPGKIIENLDSEAAAEMLCVSRQSLYAKLRRHGLGDGAPDGG
jgi:hypothetical protein